MAKEEIGNAFTYGSDKSIQLTEDDLSSIAPIDEKSIRLERFFSPNQFNFSLMAGRSLYIAPANLVAQEPFRLIAASLVRQRRWALARTVLSGKSQVVAIRPEHDLLILHDPALLRSPLPIVGDQRKVAAADTREFEKEIGKLTGPIEWNNYRDGGAAKLAALVAKKVAQRANTKTRATKRPKRSRVKSQAPQIA